MNDDDNVEAKGLPDPVVEIVLTGGQTIMAKQIDSLAITRDLMANGFCRLRTANHDHVTVFYHGVSAVRGRPDYEGATQ